MKGKAIVIARILFRDIIKALEEWLAKLWFEAKTKARLTMIELRAQRDYYYELNEDFEPVYREYKPKEPNTEAAKLGGAIRLTSKFHVESNETKNEINDDEYLESYRQTDL